MATASKVRTRKLSYKHLVIDAGNGNTKVCIGGESEIIPSLLSQNDGNYIRGGFTLAGEQWILGWDNVSRADAFSIADKDQGKLDYLHLLLAGAFSSMSHHLETGDNLKVHVLTLNTNKREAIEASVKKAADNLVIDGNQLKLTVELAGVYPEGYGASLYAGQLFSNKRRVAVLDMGNGTLNLSQYHQCVNGLPRRESFTFVPFGVHSLIENVSNLLAAETSNGRVDESLIRQALDSNSYSYLSSYEGLAIWRHSEKAAEIWAEQPKVKQLLVQCLALVKSGVPIVLVGGGFNLHVMQQKVRGILTSQGNDELVQLAEEPLVVGVSGLASTLQ